MHASYEGHAPCVSLLLPASDALATCSGGKTALMWAAVSGSTSCSRMLLSVSNVLARSRHSMTASDIARIKGHLLLAGFIDAYVLAQAKTAAIHASVPTGSPRKKTPFKHNSRSSSSRFVNRMTLSFRRTSSTFKMKAKPPPHAGTLVFMKLYGFPRMGAWRKYPT